MNHNLLGKSNAVKVKKNNGQTKERDRKREHGELGQAGCSISKRTSSNR